MGQCIPPPRPSYKRCDPDPDPYMDPYPEVRSGSPLKSNHLFIGPLPTFPENFMQIRLKFLSKVANRQRTNRQTDKQTTMITYPP